ncbi:MAG TPA: hypothetical protein VND98_11990 [Solirubrobacterales bacterium]|nr:hypothetical protein [Solirubrobacterales bacterium]
MPTSKTKKTPPAVLEMSILAILPFASLALAAELTTAGYTAQVEPICHRNSTANEKILKNVKKDVKQGKLRPAATALAKAATALNKTYAELQVVPQPGAEEAKLAKWLGYVKKEASLLSATGKALRANQKSKASHDETQLNHYANLANSTVFSFHFKYCKFEPSKYT